MFHAGVKIPLNIILLFGVIVVLVYLFSILFVLYLFSVLMLKDSFWSGLFLFFFISLPMVAATLVCTVATLVGGYTGVVNYFLDAWNDFTVDVEPGGVPDDEPLQGV